MSDYIKRLAGPYTGAGQTTFTFGFFTYQATDIYVGTAMSNDEAATILEQDIDYTVTLNDDQDAVPGGSITLLTEGGLKQGETLVIGSCLEYVKNIDLTNYSRFPPEQIDTEFNRIVIMIQQIVEETGRTLKVPATSSETPDDMIERLLAAQSQAQASADAAAASAQAAADSATEAEQIKEETAEYAEAAAIIKPYTAELQDVADHIEEVVAVGTEANMQAILTLSPNVAQILAVSQYKDQIVAVGNNIDDVVQVAGELDQMPGYLQTMQSYMSSAAQSVTDAAAQVSIAKNWATKTDGPVENGEYSAKYWAHQAANKYEEIDALGQTVLGNISNAQTAAVSAVNSAGNTQVSAVNTKAEQQIEAIESAGTTQKGLVTSEGSSQVQAVTAEGTKQVGLVSSKGTEQVNAVGSAGTGAVQSVNTAKEDALEAVQGSVQLASDWAEKLDGPVEEGKFSAKYWAQQASQGQLQANWAETDPEALSFIQNKPTLGALSSKNKVVYSTDIEGAPDLSVYLTTTVAGQTYLTKTDASSTYLSKTDATATYQPKGSYAAASHTHVTGDITNLNTFKPATSGAADKLATARTIALSGGVTGTATAFDGSEAITIPVTAVDGTKVTGTVPAATKATQDGNGSVIHTTYAKLSGAAFTGTVTVGGAEVVVTTDITDMLTQTVASSTYAPLASPALTGTPTAPTAAKGTSTTQIATTAFVQEAMGDVQDNTAAAILQAFQDFADEHGIAVPETTDTEG
ncbi:hypothetical protein [Parasutterella secunda]|uniref:hypothetical protein n=1 Tax=Parasutterella secunda TaxID=626947 RepID=UPI0025A3E5C9|nr:hypothetical protein [Parasutterella secunda]MDM8227748.1 hypothetical protein [Parasutterella secunda]